MENSLYPPYVTERIRRFDGSHCGVCYSAHFMHYEEEGNSLVNGRNIISPDNQLPVTDGLIIIPLAEAGLEAFLQGVEHYSEWQKENVRLAINYAVLRRGGAALREAARYFSFWLYDLAPPGMEWKNIVSFPLSGVVLTETFFNDNYLKFSFPFLLSSLREKEAEVILRTPQLLLPAETCTELQLTGWQEQHTGSTLFEE
ncbi:hypothetical protein [Candidatus Pantoea soli]|uniref:Uncharacterized protein n=1 Tax=Candidatus Pantoea soli TaxID=3098669 RepID=A0A518X956_9GAMM|nr:hypothetical protein [Pantoea soli]QDY40704.1 hypothetical protein D8B20_01735 [Pantoea soli]